MKGMPCLAILIVGILIEVLPSNGAAFKRNVYPQLPGNEMIGCMHMTSEPGRYTYISPGSQQVCGLYIIANPDQVIQLEFLEFDIDCDTDGLLATVDGWEIQGQFFPGEVDHHMSMEERYKTYCGASRPYKKILSSQNVLLIQALIPVEGQGYMVKVSFLQNPTPCNAVSMLDQGTVTLTNYGHRVNCTYSVLYPEVMEVVNLDVGVTPASPEQINEMGTVLKCEKRNRQDYVELMDGNGLDPYYMYREIDFCGLDSNPENMRWLLGCQHSVIRLVSSGRYVNRVTIKYRPLTDSEAQKAKVLSC